MQKMLLIVYISSAVNLFSVAELLNLLKQSRDKNQLMAITGMLLYKGGNLMQAIEGPDNAVRALFNSIKADTRHKGILTLIDEQINARSFASWSMGFSNLGDPEVKKIPGYDRFLDLPLDSEVFINSDSEVRKLMEVFHRMHDR